MIEMMGYTLFYLVNCIPKGLENKVFEVETISYLDWGLSYVFTAASVYSRRAIRQIIVLFCWCDGQSLIKSVLILNLAEATTTHLTLSEN